MTNCLKLGDISTHLELHGSGHPVVLVHGALVDSRMWQPQIGPFAERYRVVTFDLRGHGRSSGSPRRSYTVRLFAEDLHALVNALELERPAICGLSLGGMVAQAYAAAYPDELSTLVLCDTAVSTTLTLGDKLQTYLFGWSLAPTVRLVGASRYVDWSFWLAGLLRGERWFGRNRAVSEYVRDAMRAMDTGEMAKTYDAIVGFRGVDLRRIRVPTLVLNGEYESASVFQHAEHMRQRIPEVEMDVIPDAGHVSNMENPAAFNSRVLSYLAI